MGTVLLFGLAAAVYPQLLAVVVVILTRPNPLPLLWTCFLASLIVSVGSSVAILAVFRAHGSVAGASSHRLGPTTYLAAGAVALLIGVLMATRPGRALVDQATSMRTRGDSRGQDNPTGTAKMHARAERALSEGSLLVAGVVGALLAIPGPFDLLALGRLARGGHALAVGTAVMMGFALIKFLLIEGPIASYMIDPDGTAVRVSRFSSWLRANKLTAVAVVVGLVGILLIGRGISVLS
jgi:hypothetical protein